MNPYTDEPAEAISALGELKLIDRIQRWLGSASPASPAGIGDDCAVMSGSPRLQLVTVDPVIYGEHFDDSVPPRGVGEKLFKRNLSDIAAMGGRPRAAVVALALDARVRTAWLEAFYRGLASVARRYRVPVIGGDIAHHAGGLVATMTVVGEAMTDRALTRTGGRIGDWLYVTGSLGGSILGYHWKFRPRLVEGAWLAARPEVRAMMDVSDGLAKDVLALTPPGAQPVVSTKAVPISRSARLLARRTGRPPLAHALEDGEDYELLFVVNGQAEREAFEAEWRRQFPLRLTCLGRLESRSRRQRGDDWIQLGEHHGYEHLR